MTSSGDWRSAVLAVVACSALAGFLEVGLRLVEPLGVFDQWGAACQAIGPNTPLNHGPGTGSVKQRLDGSDVYGQVAGWEYEERFDELGIKRSALRPQGGDGTRVLFMGDSFIQGYDDANTVPQRAYDWIVAQRSAAQTLIILNAAYSSYSPLIFTVQAKRLLGVLRPDFVVVDIDETDFFDDAVRYRALVTRDEHGQAAAINRSIELQALAQGCARARDYSLHLVRLAAMLYYETRLALHDWLARRRERPFILAQTAQRDISPELQDRMRYFASTLDELFRTLKEYVPGENILIVRHPHRWHLRTDGRVPQWNRQVGDLVGAAAARAGVTFFDAQDELAVRVGDQPEAYYWNGDMHFNFDGIRAYGELVGRELERKLNATR